MALIPDRYLGDGVYAAFDGYNIWLDTRGQQPTGRIALNPDTLRALHQFGVDAGTAIAKAMAERNRERGRDFTTHPCEDPQHQRRNAGEPCCGVYPCSRVVF